MKLSTETAIQPTAENMQFWFWNYHQKTPGAVEPIEAKIKTFKHAFHYLRRPS